MFILLVLYLIMHVAKEIDVRYVTQALVSSLGAVIISLISISLATCNELLVRHEKITLSVIVPTSQYFNKKEMNTIDTVNLLDK